MTNPVKDPQKEIPSSVRAELHSFEKWKNAKDEELRKKADAAEEKKREEDEKRAETAAKRMKVFQAWTAAQDAKLAKQKKRERAKEEAAKVEKLRKEQEKKINQEKVRNFHNRF